MKTKTFAPNEKITLKYITPKQSHSANLVEIKTGTESLEKCDGTWSRNFDFCLGVRTADCAPISFSNEAIFGIIHAGWRGCVNGIIENMLELIKSETPDLNTNFQIGPILQTFEIQKDDCYGQIFQKFGDQFFHAENGKIIFDFKSCLKSLLPEAEFDPRITSEEKNLASWRRDHDEKRNLTLINF